MAFRSVALPERTPAQSTNAEKRSVGQGLFRKCAGCGAVATVEEMAARFHVCSACGHHHPMPVADWVRLLLDDGAFEAWDEHIAPADPLGFDDGKPYPERLARAQRNTGLSEGVRIGQASIEGRPVAFGCFVFAFMGGSMGSVVGERITRLFERAALSTAAGRARSLLGRSAHAGRHPEPHADGEDRRGARALPLVRESPT